MKLIQELVNLAENTPEVGYYAVVPHAEMQVAGPFKTHEEADDAAWDSRARYEHVVVQYFDGEDWRNVDDDGKPAGKVWDDKQVGEGRMIRDPKSSDPYIAKLYRITPAAERDPRGAYLKQLADDYDVSLAKVKQLADMLGQDEDFDALVTHVNELSDPGK